MSLLLSTVQMDDSQQHPSYQVSEALSTIFINKYYFTDAASILTAGPIVVVTFTDFM